MRRKSIAVSSWRRNLRSRWRRLDKAPWIFVFIVGSAFAATGYVAYSIYANEVDRQNLTCLALNVYFESRGEPLAGQYAVAEVTMNRVASRHYPRTVCGVVYQKNWDPLRARYVGAFSWTEFDTRALPKGEAWMQAWQIAEEVYYQRQPQALKGATHYHAEHIQPSWSREKIAVARIGRHVFYR